jgi:hypothetical protein
MIIRATRMSVCFAPFTYRTDTALPAAGAWTATAPYIFPVSGIREVTAWCKYTRGAVNGRAALQINWPTSMDGLSGAGVVGQEIVLDQTLAVSQPFDNQAIYMQNVYGPIPSGAGAIWYAVAIRVPQGVVGVQLLAAEIGVVGTPGLLQITLGGGG